MESVATSITDLFPHHLRKPGRREILTLVIAVVCFLLGLPLVSQVRDSRWGTVTMIELLLTLNLGGSGNKPRPSMTLFKFQFIVAVRSALHDTDELY